MEFKKFEFEPKDGFRDTQFYEDSPSDAREILQRQHDMTRDYLNFLVSALSSTKEGESGSEYIGSREIQGVSGETVFEQLLDMKRQITDYVSGAIPDGTIGESKLAYGSVTGEKLAEGSVSDRHFKEGAKIKTAVSAEQLNGFAAEDYCTVSLSAVTGGFRERVTDEKVSSVEGKNHNGKRYMLQQNGLIKVFDSESGKIIQTLDFSKYSTDFKIALDEEGVLYFADSTKKDYYGCVSIYKYSDGECAEVAYLKIRYASDRRFRLSGMEIYNGNLYLGFIYDDENVEISVIPLSQLESMEEAAPVYTFKTTEDEVRMVIKNGNLYCGNRKFENCSMDTSTLFCGNVVEDALGNLMIATGEFPFVSEENFPEVTSVGSFDPMQSFCFGKYLYTMKGGYIFRGRIL